MLKLIVNYIYFLQSRFCLDKCTSLNKKTNNNGDGAKITEKIIASRSTFLVSNFCHSVQSTWKEIKVHFEWTLRTLYCNQMKKPRLDAGNFLLQATADAIAFVFKYCNLLLITAGGWRIYNIYAELEWVSRYFTRSFFLFLRILSCVTQLSCNYRNFLLRYRFIKKKGNSSVVPTISTTYNCF